MKLDIPSSKILSEYEHTMEQQRVTVTNTYRTNNVSGTRVV